MSGALIILIGFVYACIAFEQFVRGERGTAIVFAGYAFSNIGLWMGTK